MEPSEGGGIVHIHLDWAHIESLVLKPLGRFCATRSLVGTKKNGESELGELTANLKADAFARSGHKGDFFGGGHNWIVASSVVFCSLVLRKT